MALPSYKELDPTQAAKDIMGMSKFLIVGLVLGVLILGGVIFAICDISSQHGKVSDGKLRGKTGEKNVSMENVSFPLSFERLLDGGKCPTFFRCENSNSEVCRHPAVGPTCMHPGISNVAGTQYLTVANDHDTGRVVSKVFRLPQTVHSLSFLRGGGSDEGSGLYVHHALDGANLCAAENGRNTNALFEDRCAGLDRHAGKSAYICLVDSQASDWGKVLVDAITLKDMYGEDISPVAVLGPPPREAVCGKHNVRIPRENTTQELDVNEG